MCRNGTECSLRNPNITCTGEPDWAIVGTWVQDDTSSLFKLVECPAGHELVGSEGGDNVLEELQECKKCSSSQYVINPNKHKCKTCPKGLTCRGTAEYTPRVIGSTWVVTDGGVLKLQTCPAGYLKVTPEDDALQECAPCPAGEECIAQSGQPCTECTPCMPGFYKTSVSNGECSMCPQNTYNENTGSKSESDCTPCGSSALTDGPGKTSRRDCKCESLFYFVGSPAGAQCMACPIGAKCADQTCALNAQDLKCPDSQRRIEGTWTRDLETDEYRLESCNAGHELVSKIEGSDEFSHDSQQCKPCDPVSEYIDNPNVHRCETCPKGLICEGTGRYDRRVPGSTWQADGGVLKLKSCPDGYLAVTEGNDADQECALCPAGHECTAQPCTQCTPCKPGYYKEFAGTELCSSCPRGTYNNETKSASESQCLACFQGATTDQEASTSFSQCKCPPETYLSESSDKALSCKTCPAGAVCPDKSCAFHHSTVNPTCPGSSDSIVGTWKLDIAERKYKVTACPAGYKFTTEQCIRCNVCLTAGGWCSRADYILNSNSTDSACQVCPEGAECNGASLRTKNNLQGATWVIEGDRYSLKSCPTGHRIVNNLGYENQKCEPCGASEYILKSDDPSYQCLPCPVR